MAHRPGLRGRRLRILGLAASIVATTMLGLTLLTGNRDLGMGYSISKAGQVSFYILAALLCAVQVCVSRRKAQPRR